MNKVFWIFFAPNPHIIGSCRLGGVLPADKLKIPKVIFLENDDEVNFINNSKAKILIFTKPFHEKAIKLAKYSKQAGVKIILICDDWNFDTNKEFKKNIKRNKFMTEIAKLSDRVVVKTKLAAKIAYKNTGIKCEIIPDCLEQESQKIIKSISVPLKIGWFGNTNNLDTILPAIKELSLLEYEIKLKIVTNLINKKNIKYFISNLKKKYLKNIKLEFVQWNINYGKILYEEEIIIVPYLEDNLRKVKSLNRITESLNMGKIVITNQSTITDGLEKYCIIGNFHESINWLIKNENQGIKISKIGRNWAIRNFNISRIANQWQELIRKLS